MAKIPTLLLLFGALLAPLALSAQKPAAKKPAAKKVTKVTPIAAPVALKLPEGFRVQLVAGDLGQIRHLVVTRQGDVYARLAKPKNGAGTLRLRDTDGNGSLDQKTKVGSFGGTGIALGKEYLYAASDKEVFRFKINEKEEVVPGTKAERIVTGLIDRGQHGSKSLALDPEGNLFVTIGAPSNSCQQRDRTASEGMQPCPLLDSTGGIWMFSPDKPDQHYGDGTRYATGLRNVVGLAWNPESNSLFAMMHGRDQLNLFPKLYDDARSADLPAECMYNLPKGGNAGWPYVYYDQNQKKKIVAPEYGGDGQQEGSAEYLEPVAAYPAHMAPNALLFYTGNQFPERYRKGVFIAFHGSWNRAPLPQEGYYVVFQPLADGKADGQWEVFADGFAGPKQVYSPNSARHRPCGLAQGPDGSLYVSDDVGGCIYKITYGK